MNNNEWYQPDNVSKVFLAVHNKRDTRTLRVTCTLKETVNGDFLQQALDKVIRIRPQFQVRIRRGLFWHYLDPTSTKPEVKEESDRPCPILYGENYKGILHYSVTYFKKRINLDIFHVLSDGSGALEFLNLLVLEYLKITHPGELDSVSVDSGASAEALNENSFSQFYDKKGKPISKPPKSYKLSGHKLPYDQLQFYELHLPASECLKKAKSCNASLTSFIGARLMLSIYDGMPSLKKNKPITLGIPVNLRNYYPSETMRNFFNTVFITHKFEGNETEEQLAAMIDKRLKESLVPENIKGQMDTYQKLEEMFLLRPIPLFIKQKVLKYIATREDNKVTATISNLGIRRLPESMYPFIDSYSAYCASNDFFMTLSSYQDDLVLGISSAYSNTKLLANFIRKFTADGALATLYASEVVK